jgi:hypothetical protein
MALAAIFVKRMGGIDRLLTLWSDCRFNGRGLMAGDKLGPVWDQIGERLAEFSSRADRLSPLDIYSRMDAIRQIAAANGLDALEALMHRSAQLALLPGHRVATRCCLEHVDEALLSESTADSTSILAALALRLH